MAEVATIKEVVGFLAEVTGKTVNQALFNLWAYSFEGVVDDELRRAAFEYADMNRFFPTPMELKSIIGIAPKTKGEAWAKFSLYVAGGVPYDSLDDTLKYVLKVMGGSKLVREQMNFRDVRITFFQMYDDLAESEYVETVRERMMLNAPVLISGLLEEKNE